MNLVARSNIAKDERLTLSPADLTKLQTWFSPSFPVGAFSYSHGLEWVVETGEIKDVNSLVDWVEGVMRYGSGRADAILLCAAWRATKTLAWSELREIADLAAALQPTSERRLESLGQGTAFHTAIMAAWPNTVLEQFRKACPDELAVPVAVGAAGAAHDLPLNALLIAFLQGFCANLISAGVRLIPLGQSDGLRVTSRLEPVVADISQQAMNCGIEDIGSSTILTDIASMCHELQYTRLFRS